MSPIFPSPTGRGVGGEGPGAPKIPTLILSQAGKGEKHERDYDFSEVGAVARP